MIRKDKGNFKVYDVRTWLTNNYSTHVHTFLQKILFFKNHAENEAGKLVPGFFFSFFLKKIKYAKSKWSATEFQYILIALSLAHN